ncbi:MAG: di-heme enzyme [Deltaproteobacteria bacterium]|nr:di-heme enzyme [Deltaproteobacteria bacterium]
MRLLTALAALVVLSAPALADTPYELPQPRGFPPAGPNIPADNPLTWEKVELGRFLFYDTRLSGNQTFACASCHEQALAFTDGRARSVGSTGEMHPRSAMALANVAFAGTLTWANNLLFDLEPQALVPMFGEHPVELGLVGREDELLARLRADARYQRLFAEAFPGAADPITLDAITKAIASFERTLISSNTPYERYAFGIDDNAISASAKRGEVLFFDENRECFHCHGGFNFTSSVDHKGAVAERQFNNNGLYNLHCADFGLPDITLPQCETTPPATRCDGNGPQTFGCYPPDNTGVYAITGNTADMGRFKAPSLRNIAVTAPYMHDGSIATLSEVLDHYAAGGRTITDGPYAGVGHDSPALGQFIRGFSLTERQKQDLLAFLEALTDDDFLTNPRYADPFAPVACPGDCDLDGRVAINELVTGVGISLETATLGVCVVSDPSADGAVTVDEIIRATRGALNGCGS